MTLAYVDPSVMSYTVQAIAGVAIALDVVFGVIWRKVKRGAVPRGILNLKTTTDCSYVMNGNTTDSVFGSKIYSSQKNRHPTHDKDYEVIWKFGPPHKASE